MPWIVDVFSVGIDLVIQKLFTQSIFFNGYLLPGSGIHSEYLPSPSSNLL